MRKRALLSEYGAGIAAAARVLDVLVIGLAAWLGHGLRFGFGAEIPAEYVACTLAGIIIGTVTLQLAGAYSSWRGAALLSILQRTALTWGVAFAMLLILVLLVHLGEFYSRLWLGYWFLGALTGLLLIRVGIYVVLVMLRRRGLNQRRVVIFGAGELGRQAARAARTANWAGFEVAAFFDDDPARAGTTIEGIPVRTDVEALPAALQAYDASEMWIALPLAAEARVRALLHELRHSTANIRMIPDLFGLRLVNYSVSDLAGMTVLNLTASPMTGANRLIKAIEDRVLALAMLVLLAPLLAAIALAIRATMGPPVLFSQVRCGWDGRPIRVYKFRSMCPDADDGGVIRQARPDDPRVTPVGRFLRRTSLDELPQLWNVLRGDMSIVGPRPHALEHDEFYKEEIDDYMKRHKVKPGITGWAQVNGFRGETRTIDDMRERVDHDLFYIENWSLWFDIRILLLTAVRVFRDPKAY